jgi:hypothetical protein
MSIFSLLPTCFVKREGGRGEESKKKKKKVLSAIPWTKCFVARITFERTSRGVLGGSRSII